MASPLRLAEESSQYTLTKIMDTANNKVETALTQVSRRFLSYYRYAPAGSLNPPAINVMMKSSIEITKASIKPDIMPGVTIGNVT